MKIKKYTIRENKTVEDALKIIDKNGEKTCFIIDVNKKLLGEATIKRVSYFKIKVWFDQEEFDRQHVYDLHRISPGC